MTDAVALKGEAREVALAEAQTVQSLARDETMRSRLAELVAAVDEGDVDGDSAELLESVLELGLQTGRIRAYYGPGRRAGSARDAPQAAARTRARRERARRLDRARGARRGDDRERQDRRRRAGSVHALDRGRRCAGIGASRRQRRAPRRASAHERSPLLHGVPRPARARLPRGRRRARRDGEGARACSTARRT